MRITLSLKKLCIKELVINHGFYMGIASISKGGISGTLTDVTVILQYAIKANASCIIICHNHPSGKVYQVIMITGVHVK